MALKDTSYYRQRAVDERALAISAEHRDVREIHEELARLYEALVGQADLRTTFGIGGISTPAKSAA